MKFRLNFMKAVYFLTIFTFTFFYNDTNVPHFLIYFVAHHLIIYFIKKLLLCVQTMLNFWIWKILLYTDFKCELNFIMACTEKYIWCNRNLMFSLEWKISKVNYLAYQLAVFMPFTYMLALKSENAHWAKKVTTSCYGF